MIQTRRILMIFGLTATLSSIVFGMTDGNLAVFKRYTEDDGLSQNTVIAVREDRNGFLWVGTINGLNRFDGYRFVVYKSNPQDPSSIANNYITAIMETKGGVLWIGTNKGLSRYDPAIDGFHSFTNDPSDPNSLVNDEVRTLFQDQKGNLWIGTEGGISKYDPEAGNFTNYNASLFAARGFRGIAEDRNGGFWIGASNGLIKFDRDTGTVAKVFKVEPKNPNSMIRRPVRAMITDRNGRLWIGSLDGGLTIFDPETEKFSNYTVGKSASSGLLDDGVRSLCETSDGTVWVGTGTAVSRFLGEVEGFVHYKHDPKNIRSLSEGDIPTISEGRNGQIWVGTSVGGLSKLNGRADRFTRFRHSSEDPNSLNDDYYIHSIWEDDGRIVWIATQRGGLNKLELGTGRFDVVRSLGHPEENSAVAQVTSILQDRSGEIWLGTPYRGLLKLDKRTQRFKEYSFNAKTPYSLQGFLIYSIAEDQLGNLWVGTGRGLSKFEKSTERFTLYPFGEYPGGHFAGENVWHVFADSRGLIWVSTNAGLNRFDPTTEHFKYFEAAASDERTLRAGLQIDSIVEDKAGDLWMASDSGLVKYARASETFEIYSEADGLPSNNIASVLVDDVGGNLWLGTGRGLTRFAPATRAVRTFDVNDGLSHGEFTPRAAFRNRAGEMYFGSVRGFVKFDPRGFSDSDFKPPVFLSDVRIFEQPTRFKQSLSELNEFDISWRENVVSFDFAALDLTDPEKLRYQWKLDGFDKNWINGGTRRTATYTNLPGGEYVLKVRATNVDGVWGDETLNLIVRVQPPFYWTYWFWLLTVILVGVLILALYRYRIGQLRAISQAQTRFTQQLITSQETERKRIAAELHDGLGQSLVIIKNRASLGLNRNDDRDRVAKELGAISESAAQALEEVREITNNLRPQLLDRLGLTKAVAAMLKKYSGVIELKSEIDAIDGLFDEHQEISIYRIIQESITNVIKHSNASIVRVKVKRSENVILIEIEDDGKGFDPQGLPAEKRSFGLIGLRERAQLLGGELVIDSKVGAGTKVSVMLKTGTQEHPQASPVPPR